MSFYKGNQQGKRKGNRGNYKEVNSEKVTLHMTGGIYFNNKERREVVENVRNEKKGSINSRP